MASSQPHISPPQSITFGCFRFDAEGLRLFEESREVGLNPKALAVLAYLIEHPGQIVSKDDLLRAVWGADVTVTDDALVQRVLDVRKALHDDPKHPVCIRTHPKRGYEWIGQISSGPATSPIAAKAGRRRGIAAAGILAAASILLGIWISRAPAPRQERRRDLRVSRLTAIPGMEDYPAFDPGGRLLAFASSEAGPSNLWILDPATGERRRLTQDSWNDSEPDWSPDGRLIAFRSEREGGGLLTIAPATGKIEQISTFGHHPRWSPDSSRIAFHTEGGSGDLFVWDQSTRQIRKVEIRAPLVANRSFPAWSSDGGALYFLGILNAGSSVPGIPGSVQLGHQIWRVPSGGGTASIVTRNFGVIRDGGFDVDRAGSALGYIGLDRCLWNLPLDRRSGDPAAPPIRLTLSTEEPQHPRFAPSGDIAFATVASPDSLWIIPFAPDGSLLPSAMERLTRNTTLERNPALSPDRKRAAYITWSGDRFEIWCVDIASRHSWRVSPPSGPSRTRPLWSRDGKVIVFTALDGPRREQYAAWLDAAGFRFAREQPLSGVHSLRNGEFEVTASGQVTNLPADPEVVSSPSGRLSLRQTRDTLELAGHPLPLDTLRPLDPKWWPDDRAVYFQAGHGGWFNIWRIEIDPVRAQPARGPRQLTDFRGSPYLLSDMNRDFAIHPQGIIVCLRENRSDLWLIR